MNKKHFLLSFVVAAMAILAAGCQKEEGTVTLGAEIHKSSNGKVYINDHTPCWHNGDQVYINNAAYSIMAATGASAQIEEVTRHDTYRAIFPASIVTGSNISNSASVPVTLPAIQHYEMVGSHQRVDVPMGAYLTNGSTLHFYNLCSIVRVTVSNSLNQDLTLSKIVLQAEQARLSGSGTAIVNGSASNAITMASTAFRQVYLDFSNESHATVNALESATFDIVVPVFTTDNVTIRIINTNGDFYENTINNVGLVHNTITTVTVNVTELITPPTNPTFAKMINGLTFKNHIPSSAREVVFDYDNNLISFGTILSSSDSPAPIYGNLIGTTWIVSTPAHTIEADTNCSSMFSDKYNITSIAFGSGFNTSNVTNMSRMFFYCSSLTSLNLSNFNTSNVTDMNRMFCGCSSLMSLDVSSFNTTNVGSLHYRYDPRGMKMMFSECRSLTELNLSNFITTNVTCMEEMFSGCISMTCLNLSNFDMSNLGCYHMTEMGYDRYRGKEYMCSGLSTSSGHCTIICPLAVENAIKEEEEYHDGIPITHLPTSGVTFTWVRPTSK